MTTRIVILSAGVLLAASVAAQAGPSEALAFAIGQCSSQPDERARLACYDQIAAQLKAGTFITTAPQVSQTSPPPFVQLPTPGASAPVAQTPAPFVPAAPTAVAQAPAPRQDSGSWYDPTSWFGKDKPRAASNKPADFGAETMPQTRTASADQARPETLDEIRANVRTVAYNPNGRFTVTLDNGQVWRQLDGDTGSARFRNKGGDVVTISRGVLGSYNLVVEGRSALFKVKRLR